MSDEDNDKENDEDTTSDKEAGSQENEVDENLLERRMLRKPATPSLPIISGKLRMASYLLHTLKR